MHFFNPVACCFLYKAKDLSAFSYFNFLTIVSTIAAAVRTSELAATLTPLHISQRHFVYWHIRNGNKDEVAGFSWAVWVFFVQPVKKPCCYETESFTTVLITFSPYLLINVSNIRFSCCNRARGHVVAWGTMLQAGKSRVRVLIRWIFFNWPIPSSRNGNEYQGSSWGENGGRRVGLTTLPPSVSRLSR
jgi:hypothetical protein